MCAFAWYFRTWAVSGAHPFFIGVGWGTLNLPCPLSISYKVETRGVSSLHHFLLTSSTKSGPLLSRDRHSLLYSLAFTRYMCTGYRPSLLTTWPLPGLHARPSLLTAWSLPGIHATAIPILTAWPLPGVEATCHPYTFCLASARCRSHRPSLYLLPGVYQV